MKRETLRYKHLRLDQAKLDRAKTILGAVTESETLARALDLVLAEAALNAALRRVRGRGRLRKLFR